MNLLQPTVSSWLISWLVIVKPFGCLLYKSNFILRMWAEERMVHRGLRSSWLLAAAGLLEEPMRIRENWKLLFPLSLCPAAASFCDELLGIMATYFSLKHTYLKSVLQGSLRKGLGVRGTGKVKRERKGMIREQCRCFGEIWLLGMWMEREVTKATKSFRRT